MSGRDPPVPVAGCRPSAGIGIVWRCVRVTSLHRVVDRGGAEPPSVSPPSCWRCCRRRSAPQDIAALIARTPRTAEGFPPISSPRHWERSMRQRSVFPSRSERACRWGPFGSPILIRAARRRLRAERWRPISTLPSSLVYPKVNRRLKGPRLDMTPDFNAPEPATPTRKIPRPMRRRKATCRRARNSRSMMRQRRPEHPGMPDRSRRPAVRWMQAHRGRQACRRMLARPRTPRTLRRMSPTPMTRLRTAPAGARADADDYVGAPAPLIDGESEPMRAARIYFGTAPLGGTPSRIQPWSPNEAPVSDPPNAAAPDAAPAERATPERATPRRRRRPRGMPPARMGRPNPAATAAAARE